MRMSSATASTTEQPASRQSVVNSRFPSSAASPRGVDGNSLELIRPKTFDVSTEIFYRHFIPFITIIAVLEPLLGSLISKIVLKPGVIFNPNNARIKLTIEGFPPLQARWTWRELGKALYQLYSTYTQLSTNMIRGVLSTVNHYLR